jgi:hypothetical protein
VAAYAANGSGANGTALGAGTHHDEAGYAFANGDGYGHAPGQSAAPHVYRPPTAATAGELAARVRAMEPAGQVEPLGPAWLAVTVVIGVMAALIALGGMVLSFRAVSVEMVPAFGNRWAWLVPIVVDLTVFVFSGVDLVLARLDMGHPLARWTVYGATFGTVWLNYSAGGSAAGRVAHVLMPSIWVVFVELMRHVVRRQVNLSTASHREPIPAARWLLSPWPTLKLWRRMVLWRIHSYPRALDQEKMRLGAVATAREMYGRFWRMRISPLIRLQINLGEVGAGDLRPELYAQPAAQAQSLPAAETQVAARSGPAGFAVAGQAAQYAATAQASPAGAQAGGAPIAQGQPHAGAAHHAAQSAAAPNGQAQAQVAAAAAASSPPPSAAPAAPPVPGQRRAAHGREPAMFASQPIPGPATSGPVPPVGRAAGPALAAALAATQTVPSPPAAPAADGQAPVPAAVADTAVRPAAGNGVRQDPPHVEFQAPPSLPPLPRRSVRESELLTAAREVERWRGQPSATRISRELGIGMPLATSLANALREEEGPGE